MTEKTTPVVPTMVNWHIDQIKPYDNNPRLNADAVAGVKMSIEQFGFMVPVTVDADGVLITGHTRLLAAKELGLTTIPVIVATHLSEAQVAAYRLADNRLSENSKWDESKLAEELRHLEGMGISLEFTGFSKEELDCLCGTVTAQSLDNLDYEAVCGDISEQSAKENLSVRVAAGNYNFTIPMEAFRLWEETMLSEHKSTKEVITFMRKALRMDEAVAAAQAEAKGE